MDLLTIVFSEDYTETYDDIVDISWNEKEDIAKITNSKGTDIYLNMYSAMMVINKPGCGKPYIIN